MPEWYIIFEASIMHFVWDFAVICGICLEKVICGIPGLICGVTSDLRSSRSDAVFFGHEKVICGIPRWSRLKPGPARPGPVKPGRHSLITGPAWPGCDQQQRHRRLKSGPSRPGREPDRQSGAFEVTTVDVVT